MRKKNAEREPHVGQGRRQRRRAVRGGGPHRALRAVQRPPRRGRGEEGVPRLRPGGGHRGGVEPGAAEQLRRRQADAGAPLLGGPHPPVAPAREHHRAVQRVGRQGGQHPQLHNRGVHLREPEGLPEAPPARVGEGAEEVVEADPAGPGVPAQPRPLHNPQGPQLQQRLHQWQRRPD
ncbi:putative serine/threonine-protein kinase WNK11 [Iris pallida]|uniref:Serine/threonine-protein kinase WNK11 n=1 Tax=Iris pallida TaxID=29817 RepID=A0AAX6F9C2_IRIPA|nr:putative serine/threonine-protein kinase WNK11 [Iris pallida]